MKEVFGTVEKGVVRLPDSVSLPEGSRVRVERRVLLNRGDASFVPGPSFAGGRLWGVSSPADLDGDGDVDLVAGLSDPKLGPQLAFRLNDGKAVFSSPLYPIGVPALYGAFIARDFDGDGKVDLAAKGGCLAYMLLNRTTAGPSRDLDRDGIPDECQPTAGGQVPGDGNQDGRLDVSDPIWLLRHLFEGSGTAFSCEGGTAADPGRGDLALLDSSGDGSIDISDPIAVLRFLFFERSPPHPLGAKCVAIRGCPARCAP